MSQEQVEVLTVLLLLLTTLPLVLLFLPVAECDACLHCRTKRTNQAAVACPICRKFHEPGKGAHD